MTIAPIYTVENCEFAYQLCWSLTVFWRSIPLGTDWLPDLQNDTECDGVRILRHRVHPQGCSQFLISTRPEILPSRIPWSVKGRLQRILHSEVPNAFRRNYHLCSVGKASGAKVENYVASQLRHHGVEGRPLDYDCMRDLQYSDLEVNLLKPRSTAHGLFLGNLHLVFPHNCRYRDIRPDALLAARNIIRRSSDAKGHLLSRIGILPDHLHLTLGIRIDESPRDIAISYMNNIAFAHGMKPVLVHGCYMMGFGKYDLGVIPDE